ncbi:MAG: class I SAM-dependent methyltransferase [Acetobacteraceae bacterium]|nr:class I SAM-dependent methyltransferase [Acetobacteraceae bacterium]
MSGDGLPASIRRSGARGVRAVWPALRWFARRPAFRRSRFVSLLVGWAAHRRIVQEIVHPIAAVVTPAELEAKLAECEQAAAVSDDALRQVFKTFRLAIDARPSADPFSPDYRDWQLALYERISGYRYGTANEASEFDYADAATRPFPYRASPKVAGEHLGAIAFLISTLRLKPGARVLDMGPGWGNTSLALAQLGFHVTALDVEPRFCVLINDRARRAGVTIETVNTDFFWIEETEDRFDAIIFFESFHHCADPVRLLVALPKALAPEGHVYFGAEPISPLFPMPWGVRTDGESLWAIRHHGWLELGFRDDWFREALARAGMVTSVRASADLPGIKVWDATAIEGTTGGRSAL